MSHPPSQDPQHPVPTEGGDRAEADTQQPQVGWSEPAAPEPAAPEHGTPEPAAPEHGTPEQATTPVAVTPDTASASPDTASPGSDAARDTSSPATAPFPPASPARLDDTGTAGSPYDEPGATRPSVLSADSAARQHRLERPVPRSGLAEQHSAGYLTGERVPPPPAPAGDDPAGIADAAPPATTPDAGAAGQAPPERRSWAALPPAARTGTGTDDPDTAVILDGASVEPQLRSRAKAHWLGVLVALVLVPVAWYLIADAGSRLTLPTGSPWRTGNLNVAALLELAGGLLVLAIVLLAARWSSVGPIIVGSLVLVVGVPFVAAPQWTQELLEPALAWLREQGDLGGNLAHHLLASGSTGRLLVAGLALVMLGVVSHGARRLGRREAIARARLSRD